MDLKLYENLGNSADDDLDRMAIAKYRGGDSRALNEIMSKYKNFVRAKASPFFIVGADREDILQEGMLGLYKATANFDLDRRDISFSTFAALCIKRQIITAIKSSNRQKHIPLNSSVSLDKCAFDEESDKTIMEMLDTKTVPDPLEAITSQETYRAIENKMGKILSGFEQQVLNQYLSGYSYEQIARQLDTHTKAVDNAIQRIKKKVDKHIVNDQEIDI